ncbi:GNAT family N-acetyltransferase [Bifidobacterium xylocopae]|nr:GNAT family N-acetyltransferase [Bifidobacterium xylocopae]
MDGDGIRIEQVGPGMRGLGRAAWAYMQDCKAADDGRTAGLGCLERFDGPEEAERGWADQAAAEARGEGLPEGWVPALQFCALDEGDAIVGMAQLRLELTDFLLLSGGHVGYSVHPRRRRRGYAKLLLAHCLDQAGQHGLDRVLITCDASNEGSRRTILACGGVLEDARSTPGGCSQRYWVDLLG